MKNEYAIEDDKVIIYLPRKSYRKNSVNPLKRGEIPKAVISISDLDKINNFPGRWNSFYSPNTRSFYVRGSYTKNTGENIRILLHRYLMEPPENLVVDHINHDTLDNRRENLKIVTHRENSLNIRNDAQKRGLRGLGKSVKQNSPYIWYSKKNNRYVCHLRHNRKWIYVGCFKTIEEAQKGIENFQKIT